MINSRQKGAGGEREFAKLIHDELGVKMKRNLDQARDGGHDLIAEAEQSADQYIVDQINQFSIEVKRNKNEAPNMIKKWWKQTTRQAEQANKIPLLAYRGDSMSWKIILPISVLVNRDDDVVILGETVQNVLNFSLSTDSFFYMIREGELR